MYAVLFCLQFFTTLIPRIIITNYAYKRIRKGKLKFNTIIVGDERNAINLLLELKQSRIKNGLNFIGFVHVVNKEKYLLEDYLPNMGNFENINNIVKNNNVEEIVIAIELTEHRRIKNILYKLQGINIPIKIIPSMYDIFTGKVKMTALFGIPLIEINHNLMPIWQQHVKTIFDFSASLFALLILSPLCLVIAVIVKSTSPGPIFFRQERIGKNSKPFNIIKFRTMYIDAEKKGPSLSTKNDPRITNIGQFLRKTRIDEIPQFINVIRGEMSLVGPRPERQFYINKILEKAPYYSSVLSVKPGITGWGQVKNGYTSTIEDMVVRLRYDLLYIENRSIFLDLKILFFTVAIVFQKKGL
jgi:exopolysaccharide biosynthesis polyprenyl glycosylphosphotransferase